MYAKTWSATLDGIEASLTCVEVFVQRAVPKLHITGLASDVVRESGDRIRAALRKMGFSIPTGRVLVHLSPAPQKKSGSQLDLSIALALLSAERQLELPNLEFSAFLGELSLEGKLNRVEGIFAMLEKFEKDSKIERVFVPYVNHAEASYVKSQKILLAESLGEILEYFLGKNNLTKPSSTQIQSAKNKKFLPRLSEIQGQALAKKAIEIALSGGHHLLLIGPPGVGKSHLAAASQGLLPNLTDQEALEVLKIHSDGPLNLHRPFRSPHHSISTAGLLGGGSASVKPGEVTYAHRGVLFLDEWSEFHKNAIEGLREPLETGEVYIHRVGKSARLPARFTLIAAMNPCACGFAMSYQQTCQCSFEAFHKHRKKISGPILDRMDLFVSMQSVDKKDLLQELDPREDEKVLERITQARVFQNRRYQEHSKKLNSEQTFEKEDPRLNFSKKALDALDKIWDPQKVSFRRLQKTLRVARTVADVEKSETVEENHLILAWSLRCPNYSELFWR